MAFVRSGFNRFVCVCVCVCNLGAIEKKLRETPIRSTKVAYGKEWMKVNWQKQLSYQDFLQINNFCTDFWMHNFSFLEPFTPLK